MSSMTLQIAHICSNQKDMRETPTVAFVAFVLMAVYIACDSVVSGIHLFPRIRSAIASGAMLNGVLRNKVELRSGPSVVSKLARPLKIALAAPMRPIAYLRETLRRRRAVAVCDE